MVKVEPIQKSNAASQTEEVVLAKNDPALRTNEIGPVLIQRTKTTVVDFPNFALAAVRFSILRENYGNQKLRALSANVKNQIQTIDLLLNLNSELISLPDKEPYELTPKIKDLLFSLERENIQIGKDFTGKINKEKLGEMKSQISAHIDKLRTSLQTTISTEIQPEANNLQSIMNIVQQIIQMDGRLKKKTQEVTR